MKYIRRAVKYFIQISVLLVLIMAVLMLSGMVSKDITVAFQQGWKSVGYIALAFAGMSAIYPLFGYGKRVIPTRGEPAETRPLVEEAMSLWGYVLEKEDGDTLVFRLSSPTARAARLWEDRITLTRVLSGYEIEGLMRDQARVYTTLSHKLQHHEGD